ncbi:MAG: DsbA family protein [Pseudomonadota bacterium]
MTRPVPAARPGLAALAGLALAAFAAPAPAAAQADLPLDPEDRAVLRAEVREYLLENPEVIMEALQALEARQRDAQTASDQGLVRQHAQAIFDDGHSHVAGNPEGDVTVVEFIDYNCGYCKRAHDDVRKLVETDPGLRYVVKEFPILGPSSITASRAALAARDQQDGRLYMAFNDALMSHEGSLTDAKVWEIAGEVGLDVEALREAAERPEIEDAIRANYELARALKIEGTPTFVIGERLVRGYVPLDRLREAVAEERSSETANEG